MQSGALRTASASLGAIHAARTTVFVASGARPHAGAGRSLGARRTSLRLGARYEARQHHGEDDAQPHCAFSDAHGHCSLFAERAGRMSPSMVGISSETVGWIGTACWSV